MNDPLSDQRAGDLLSADPVEVWSLASTFRHVAGDAESISAALRGSEHDATWTGAAADAFRGKLGQIPGQLEQLHGSYLDVANALTSYEGELASVQPAFQRLRDRLVAARASLASAQGQLNTAQSHLLAAENGPLLGSSQISSRIQTAQLGVDKATAPVTALQTEVNGLEAQGNNLLDQFQQARDGCQSKISSACAIAPHQQSWWDQLLHGVGNGVADVWRFVKWANGYDALANLIGHPDGSTFLGYLEYLGIASAAAVVGITAGEVLAGVAVGAGFEAALFAALDVEAGAGIEEILSEVFADPGDLASPAGILTGLNGLANDAEATIQGYDAVDQLLDGHFRTAGVDSAEAEVDLLPTLPTVVAETEWQAVTNAADREVVLNAAEGVLEPGWSALTGQANPSTDFPGGPNLLGTEAGVRDPVTLPAPVEHAQLLPFISDGAGSQREVVGALSREAQPPGGTASPTPPGPAPVPPAPPASGTVPPQVTAMTNMADSLLGKPYVWGGGHSTFANETSQPGFDCSGFVSAVLHAGGYLSAPQTTSSLPDQPGIVQGPGQYVTIWDRCTGPYSNQHVIIEVNGKWFECGGNPQFNPSPNDGVAQLTPQEAQSELSGAGAPFQPFHPAGL